MGTALSSRGGLPLTPRSRFASTDAIMRAPFQILGLLAPLLLCACGSGGLAEYGDADGALRCDQLEAEHAAHQARLRTLGVRQLAVATGNAFGIAAGGMSGLLALNLSRGAEVEAVALHRRMARILALASARRCPGAPVG